MMSSFGDLVREYKTLCETEGAEAAKQLANAVIVAEKAEGHRTVLGEGEDFLKGARANRKERLDAWAVVNRQRNLLRSIVEDRLTAIVLRMRQAHPDLPHIAQFERDLVMRAGILISLGKATATRDETMALLYAWSAPVLLRDTQD